MNAMGEGVGLFHTCNCLPASESAKIGPQVSDDALRHVHFMQIKLHHNHAQMGLHHQNRMPFQNKYFTNAIVYSATPHGKKTHCFRY